MKDTSDPLRSGRLGLISSSHSLLVIFLVLAASGVLARAQLPGVLLIDPTNTVWSIWTNGTNPGYGLTPGRPEWAQPAFDDRAWPTGRGLFGNDSGYPYPFQTITPPPVVTRRFYARTRFSWNSSVDNVVLRGTNFIDDGAVVYLNGVEIYRFNMPEGPTTFTTLALAALVEPVVVPVQVELGQLTNGNANPLVLGENVLAVETASNTETSSDTVWGMTLFRTPDIECHPGAVVSPAATNILTCRSATFVASIPYSCPGPQFLQWYRIGNFGEELLPGQTGATLTISNASPADIGEYYVKLTTLTGTVMSTPRWLTVEPDDAGPEIVSAELRFDSNTIRVSFNEPILVAAQGGAADDVRAWRVTSVPGEVLTVLGAKVLDGVSPAVQLEIRESLVPGRRYSYETLLPIADLCGGNLTAAGQVGLAHPPPLPPLNIAYSGSGEIRLTWAPAVGVRLFSASAADGSFSAVAGNPQGRFVVSAPGADSAGYFRLGY